MRKFELFGADHLGALALVGLLSWAAFKVGRGPHRRKWNILGILIFTVYAFLLYWWRLRDGFQGYADLPLWLCDFVFFLCFFGLLSPRKTPLILATYWGLAGTLQALITPDVDAAFPSFRYFLFFAGHGLIVIVIFFLLGKNEEHQVADGRAPLTAFFWLLAYSLGVGSIDHLFDWNYGYLCRKPVNASVLDAFGPWPNYILVALVVALILFFLLSRALVFSNVSGSAAIIDDG